jgi:hypothetical protein
MAETAGMLAQVNKPTESDRYTLAHRCDHVVRLWREMEQHPNRPTPDPEEGDPVVGAFQDVSTCRNLAKRYDWPEVGR